jgi:type I restriction enzyme S subunit
VRLPHNWTHARLEDISDITLGQSPPGSSYNVEGVGLPFFQGKAEFGTVRPTIKKWTTDPKKLASTDDVLLSVRAPVGPSNLAPCDCAVGRGLAAIHPRGGIVSLYVLWGLRATANTLADQATGTTFEAVNGSQVRAHLLPLAPMAEQRRIVAAIEEHFSRLDAGDASLHRAAAQLERLREAVYTSAVMGSWPTARLGTLLREPLRNGHSAKASQDGTGIRSLTLSAVTFRDFSEKNTKLTIAEPARVRGLWLEPGDVLIERSNTPELVGTAALFRGQRDWSIFPDLLIRVRPLDELLPEFLEIVLKARPTRRYFQQSAQGIAGSMPKIDQRDVEDLVVPVPLLDEQSRIVAAVERQLSIIDAMSAQIDRGLRRSAALRRSILEHAFTGKLVPQDPSDEPASVLLERIANRRATAEETNGGRRSRRATMKA